MLIMQQHRLKVFRLSRLARDGDPYGIVCVLTGTGQDINDTRFTHIGETHHAVLDPIIVAFLGLTVMLLRKSSHGFDQLYASQDTYIRVVIIVFLIIFRVGYVIILILIGFFVCQQFVFFVVSALSLLFLHAFVVIIVIIIIIIVVIRWNCIVIFFVFLLLLTLLLLFLEYDPFPFQCRRHVQLLLFAHGTEKDEVTILRPLTVTRTGKVPLPNLSLLSGQIVRLVE